VRGPTGLDGREYKLLLEPGGFPGAPSSKAAKSFWTSKLKPIIDHELDLNNAGKSRASGHLRPNREKQRSVAFLDTKKGHLAAANFALRLRTRFTNGEATGLPEVTLKFRTPDFLLAAEYYRLAKNHPGDTTLEEDIAPLQIARRNKPVTVAKPRSVFSRFSVSTKLTDLNGSFDVLGDVLDQFGALKDGLGRIGKAAKRATLVPGPTICEWVFEDATVDLGENLNAEFGFTIWYVSRAGSKRDPWKRAESGNVNPRVAEISFDFQTKQGRMDRAAAQRASKLFLGMQSTLPVNKTMTSKTALGLPSGA
jgi:hypothetical protein